MEGNMGLYVQMLRGKLHNIVRGVVRTRFNDDTGSKGIPAYSVNDHNHE